MLTSLKIRGFRGITECVVDNLARINVFIGRNNQGKSSILEALYLASSSFDADEPLKRNTSKLLYLLNRRGRRGLDWRSKEILWYRYNTAKPIEIEIYWGKRKKLEIDLVAWHDHPLVSIPTTKRAYMAFRQIKDQLKITARWACLDEGLFVTPETGHGVGKPSMVRMFDRAIPDFNHIRNFMGRMMFLDSSLIYEMERIELTLWDDLLNERLDKLVTAVLRQGYEIDVEDLTYVPKKGILQLAAKLPKTTIRVDDLGDGARYSMIWTMVAALANNTALLIEEPENHQHPAGLVKSLEMVLSLVKKNDIQLFATTHSSEFLGFINRLAKENQIDMAVFFVEMDNTGRIEPRQITPSDAANLQKIGLDPRFLDII